MERRELMVQLVRMELMVEMAKTEKMANMDRTEKSAKLEWADKADSMAKEDNTGQMVKKLRSFKHKDDLNLNLSLKEGLFVGVVQLTYNYFFPKQFSLSYLIYFTVIYKETR